MEVTYLDEDFNDIESITSFCK